LFNKLICLVERYKDKIMEKVLKLGWFHIYAMNDIFLSYMSQVYIIIFPVISDHKKYLVKKSHCSCKFTCMAYWVGFSRSLGHAFFVFTFSSRVSTLAVHTPHSFLHPNSDNFLSKYLNYFLSLSKVWITNWL
jgi:hypothetical protein